MFFERHLEIEGFSIIPESSSMYSIDVEGEIIDSDGKPVESTQDADGHWVVNLPLWDGLRSYKVALLVALTFKPIYIDVSKWNKIDVLYADDDKNNLHASNLVWYFPDGIESDEYPGRRHIPFYSRYVIDQNGRMFDTIFKKEIEFKPTHRGYYSVSLKPDIGSWSIAQRHRLIALAWRRYGYAVGRMQVNHIDGENGNDVLDNLEWVTNKVNSIHRARNYAKLLNVPIKRNLKVYSRCDKNKKIVVYTDIGECARVLGLSVNSIHYRCFIDVPCVYPDFLQFRYEQENIKWFDQSSDELLWLTESLTAKVEVRNVSTGEILSFDNPRDASAYLEIQYGTLLKFLKLNSQPILPGYLQPKRKIKRIPWRESEDFEKEHEQAIHGSAVLCRNVKTNEITEYENATECARALGLSDITVSARIRKYPQAVFTGYLQFKLKSDPTPWRRVDDPDAELERYKDSVKVYVRDIFTKEEQEFSSMSEASEKLGFTDAVFKTRRDGNYPFPHFNYQFKFDDSNWVEYSDEDLEMFKLAISRNKPFRGRGFKITDTHTGLSKLYTDRDAVLEDFVINRSFISELAKIDGLFRYRWRISYYFKD